MIINLSPGNRVLHKVNIGLAKKFVWLRPQQRTKTRKNFLANPIQTKLDPRLNEEQIEKMNRPITSTDIETVILKTPTNKSPGSAVFTGKFYQTFREELTPILLKSFQKIADEGTLSTHSMRPPSP